MVGSLYYGVSEQKLPLCRCEISMSIVCASATWGFASRSKKGVGS